jgi:glycerophosphoryl diester phosphodiesterase
MMDDLGWLLERCISHRGLHTGNGSCPENSMKAFQRSVEMEFPIELDARLLADGKVAVFHDQNTARMTGFDRAIERMRSSEVKMLRLMGSDQLIPLLEEALELVGGKVPVLIELKIADRAGPLEKAVMKARQGYPWEHAVQSFNPWSVLWFRRNAPHVVCGQLSGDLGGEGLSPFERYIFEHLFMDRLTRPRFIGYEARCLPKRAVSRERSRGIPVLAWTVQSEEEERRVRPFCDNIIFEGYVPERERA